MRAPPAFLAFLLATSASATFGDDSALRRCRQIADPASRLACYDALPLGGPSAPATPAPAARSPGVAPAAPSASPSPPGAAPAPAPRGAQVAPPAEAPRAGLEAGFGLEGRVAPAQLASIESHIPGTFTGWGPNTRIRLANGQVWQVAGDEGSRSMQLRDPKIRIRRAMMGAFYMEFEAHNHSPRVRRVE